MTTPNHRYCMFQISVYWRFIISMEFLYFCIRNLLLFFLRELFSIDSLNERAQMKWNFIFIYPKLLPLLCILHRKSIVELFFFLGLSFFYGHRMRKPKRNWIENMCWRFEPIWNNRFGHFAIRYCSRSSCLLFLSMHMKMIPFKLNSP